MSQDREADVRREMFQLTAHPGRRLPVEKGTKISNFNSSTPTTPTPPTPPFWEGFYRERVGDVVLNTKTNPNLFVFHPAALRPVWCVRRNECRSLLERVKIVVVCEGVCYQPALQSRHN